MICHIRRLRRRQAAEQRGAVLVAALVCLLVTVAMVGQLLRGAVQSRRALRQEHHARQAEQLLNAGVLLAVAHHEQNTAYAGEQWDVPADELSGHLAGRVVIEAEPEQQGIQLRVRAEYPLGGVSAVRRSYSFVIPTVSTQDKD
ncbi:hypothetical protein Pla175_25590 [Pirellulimonas nuda]|uniref:Uncharacterized protein n=1 Tax=Pirellulimonas nuda TaxID=2528009 RepID=A0A518DCF7_9BACT|nr:hypothetical protein [Pirellulimonas nuda]QDU89172.1 hypothetical protein Pla175_25590 [Pirellulimonas nuda]